MRQAKRFGLGQHRTPGGCGGCRRGACCGGSGRRVVGSGFCDAEAKPSASSAPTIRSPTLPSGRGFSFGAIKLKGSTVAKRQKPQTSGYKQQALSVATHHEPRAAPDLPLRGRWRRSRQWGVVWSDENTGARGGRVTKYDRTFRPCNANYPHPNPPPEEGEKEGRIMPEQLGCGRGRPPPYGRGRRARGSAAVGSGK